jgi:hypothetical protein
LHTVALFRSCRSCSNPSDILLELMGLTSNGEENLSLLELGYQTVRQSRNDNPSRLESGNKKSRRVRRLDLIHHVQAFTAHRGNLPLEASTVKKLDRRCKSSIGVFQRDVNSAASPKMNPSARAEVSKTLHLVCRQN